MDVTKANFVQLLPSIKEAIEGCDFMAFDTEFTGLNASEDGDDAFETMEERYKKCRGNCSKFLILQFGLSTFKYHPEQKKYTHKDFNFYVFPRPHSAQAADPIFLCQTSSLHFLASNGFDFNKVIYQGIPYLSHEQEEKLRLNSTNKQKMEQDSLAPSNQTPKTKEPLTIDIPNEHKQFIDEIQSKVDTFMSNKDELVLRLEPCLDKCRQKLIFNTVRQKHQKQMKISLKGNNEKNEYIKIIKCSNQAKQEKVDTAVGFRKVIDYMSESKKLIVGHCIYLDIFHMIGQFFFPLPEDLKDFKSMVRMKFPYLLDTKHLASAETLQPFVKDTSLPRLLEQVRGKAFELPTIESETRTGGYKFDSKKYHEAGFDAFSCGVCYIGLSQKLGSICSPTIEYIETSSKILHPYKNRFYILRHYDIKCLNLSGPDPEPNRENVFHVSFPRDWKMVDLVELFLPYGNIDVCWLDDMSALIALKSTENTILAKSTLLHKFNLPYYVKAYSEYKRGDTQDNYSAAVSIPGQSSEQTSEVHNRSNSGSTGGFGGSTDLIPEEDEGTDLPPSKRLKSAEGQ